MEGLAPLRCATISSGRPATSPYGSWSVGRPGGLALHGTELVKAVELLEPGPLDQARSDRPTRDKKSKETTLGGLVSG